MEFNTTNIKIGNNSQKMLPVPIQKNPAPNVEKPDYYGKSPYPMAYQVSSRKNDYSQYENILDPSPRNQLLNIPLSKNSDLCFFKTCNIHPGAQSSPS